jgi:hypothetical protein
MKQTLFTMGGVGVLTVAAALVIVSQRGGRAHIASEASVMEVVAAWWY